MFLILACKKRITYLPGRSIENLWNNKKMIGALENDKNVKAVFSGHNHKGLKKLSSFQTLFIINKAK